MFVNKEIRKKIILTIFSSLIVLATTGCGDEEPIIKAETDQSKPAVVPDQVLTESDEFELEDFSFYGDNVLDEDLTISARKVIFRFKSKVKIKSFNLRIKAEEVIFENDSSLFSFTSNEYNACKKSGSKSGSVEIESLKTSGSPTVDLAGQNSGQIGIYLGAQVHSSHAPIKRSDGTWYKGCVSYVRGKYPKDVPHLMIPKAGGAPGQLLIQSSDYSGFDPLISNRVSLGSYKALVEGSTKKISWWREVPAGVNGQPGEVCYFFNSEYLCK